MAKMLAIVLVAFVFPARAISIEAHSQLGRGSVGVQRERSMLQTYSNQLSGAKNRGVTPVTRVVNLLKEMSATLDKEQEEDEGLHKTLMCWCNENVYNKKLSAEANQDKIDSLTASIEQLTAKGTELKTKIKELEDQVAADKTALSEAAELRKKQLQEFQKMELDSIAALENLKAAITVLSKHQGAAFPQMPLSFLAVGEDEETVWSSEHESQKSFSFDEFLRKENFHLDAKPTQTHFLQSSAQTEASSASVTGATLQGWSMEDVSTVRKAMAKATALLQARNGQGYMPGYDSQSGEIFGMLKQLKEEMEQDLSEAQKTEAARAANFNELRAAKTSEIESGEKMSEEKEDEKATTDNDLAEAKEDLAESEGALAEDKKFSGNAKKTCDEADANFELRKKARLQETQAVAETIEILTGDEAKDAMDTTFKFVQTASQRKASKSRQQAAAFLRRSGYPQLALMATSVELDAFTKVKQEIDKMIATLKTQSADEVKKNDWCKSELQENEITTMKTTDLKADLEATIGSLESKIKTLAEEVEKAHNEVSAQQVALQQASANRKSENLDFQRTVADQAATAEILKKALDKLATFYDEAAFTQTGARRQTPPVAQMEYSKSSGAGGVMSMIEKLILDTKEITAESKKSEGEAQAAYEALVADTNDSIDGLTKEITSKTKAKARAKKDLSLNQDDLADAVREIEELGKTNADLHADCDYVMKNFMIRQKARSEEVEALQQAKQILSGADLS